MAYAYGMYMTGCVFIAVAGVQAGSVWTVAAATSFFLGTVVMATQ